MNEQTFYNYGWICPKCGKVYSPLTPVCYNCNSSFKPETRDGSNHNNENQCEGDCYNG